MDQSTLSVGVLKYGMYYYMAVTYCKTKDDTFTTAIKSITEMLVDDQMNIKQIKDVTNDMDIVNTRSPIYELAMEVANYGIDKVVGLFQCDTSHYATGRTVLYKGDVYELVSPLYKRNIIDLFEKNRTDDTMCYTEIITNILRGVLLNEPNRNESDRLQFSAEA